MTLIIEDGTGKLDADSFATAAELVTYAANYGAAIPADTPGQESLLRRAALAMDGYTWKGARTNGDQALSWPRRDVTIDERTLPSDSIPVRIKSGQMALAAEIHTDDIDPVDKRTGAVTKERVEGAVDVQYAAPSAASQKPAVTASPSSLQFTAYIARKGLFAIRA
ncbi:DnaT-like ssDNA-binding protein [Pseudomonas sp. GL-RE-26]|uniref:DnaT-like ssDNA-binding protein n=1 Tax=Pseudomonas sp. GL-RE-26 TaxID=2832390 RepID=UPI001CC029AE|nr:DnaT-like ssDNA-binding protein [Pseudomonas sp. GL-RE-26]